MQCFRTSFFTYSSQVLKSLNGKLISSHSNTLPKTNFELHSSRHIFSLANEWFEGDNSILKNVMSDAEKVLGLPTSSLSLPTLLSDELRLIASSMKKLAKSSHPLVVAASGILGETKHTIQSRGLVVLLLSKVISTAAEFETKYSGSSETFQSQRSLSELTELIYIGFMVHRGIVDRNFLIQNGNLPWQAEMELGNKMAVLSGDFLLASACVALAELKNSKVISLMSNAIRDMSKGFFIIPESGRYSQISSLDNIPCSVQEWENIVYLSHGSLLCNACRSASELVEGGDRYSEDCAEFAKHMTLAQQARLDIRRISKGNAQTEKPVSAISELCALPVSIAADSNGGKQWLEEFVAEDNRDPKNLVVVKDKLISAVSNDSVASKKSEEVCSFHREMALKSLHKLPDNEARKTVEHLTMALSAGSRT